MALENQEIPKKFFTLSNYLISPTKKTAEELGKYGFKTIAVKEKDQIYEPRENPLIIIEGEEYRIYLGSSDWWDDKAQLQEDDKSGYKNIFKVQIYLQHLTDPEQSQDYANRIGNLIKILVPEWSNETSSVSIDKWSADTINNAKRNDDNKREGSIVIGDKEVRIISDDIGWGSITLIVTENFDKTKSNYSIPENGFLEELLLADEKNSDKDVSLSEPEKQDEEIIKENSDDEPMTKSTNDSEGGGCLIATATYGSELAPQVQQLRELRDNKLLQTESGTKFMSTFNDFYYSFSPIIADYERENPVFKEAVKITLIPLLSSLSILNYVDMDSEAEVLEYGISLILLNVGMYFVAPMLIVWRIRNVTQNKMP